MEYFTGVAQNAAESHGSPQLILHVEWRKRSGDVQFANTDCVCRYCLLYCAFVEKGAHGEGEDRILECCLRGRMLQCPQTLAPRITPWLRKLFKEFGNYDDHHV